jgi:uncharacterized membrane protein YfcA
MDFIFTLIGLIAGYFSACLGISSGSFLMPMLMGIGLSYQTAISTSLFSILLASILSKLLYDRVYTPPDALMIVPAIITAIIGDIYIVHQLPHIILQFTYAAIMFFSVDLLSRTAEKYPQHPNNTIDLLPRPVGKYRLLYILCGIISGLMACLVGLGSALIVVPILILLANYSYERAIKAAVTATIFASFFALGTEFVSNFIPWTIAIITALGTLIGSFFGILTRRHLDPVLVIKATYVVAFTLGFSMLMVILFKSF